MRKDAEANRERLVLAGKKLLQELGGAVPVERICAEAGVTRGTFYRNFPDRATLYAAVLDHELLHMSAQLAQPDLDPLAFLRMLAEMTMVYDRFLAILPEMSDYPRDSGEAKILAAITPSIERAKASGHLRPHVTGEDIMIACRMVGSDWRLDRAPNRQSAMEKRLSILLSGLSLS